MCSGNYYEHISFAESALPIRINRNSKLFLENATKPRSLSWHEQLEILYFHSGDALVYCGDTIITATGGDVVIIHPFEFHHVAYAKGSPEYDCLMIDTSLYRDTGLGLYETRYLDLISTCHVRFENLIRPSADLIPHIQALCLEFHEKSFAYELSMEAHAFALLANLFRNHICQGDACRRWVQNFERYDRIRPALRYMQCHLSERISLDGLARVCSLSPSHLCRIFRQLTNTTPMQFLTDMRLQEADALLKKSDKSVAQIAYAVGFADAEYLSRRFKRQFGITPLEVKKKHVGNPYSLSLHK